MTTTQDPQENDVSAALRGFVIGAALISLPAPALAESLSDAIVIAYQTNPTLLNARANLRFTDEGYVQARAGYRPQVSVQVTGQRQDYVSQTANSGEAVITASQTLYSGGRTAAAVSAAEADILSGRETLRATEASVLQSVVQAYADVLRDQEGLTIRETNLVALQAQLEESRARAKVGDLTRTDVAQSQGYVAQAHQDLATAKAQLEVSRSNYALAVGQRPGKLDPLPPLPNMPVDVDQAFHTAEAGNPNLRASLYAEQAVRMRLVEARDQRLPNVSVRVQYGAVGPPASSNPFVPAQPNFYPMQATASATISQPLWAGGAIDSQVRQQKEREINARLQTEQTRRTVVQQISQAWASYIAAHENITFADEGVKANEVAYEGVLKERQADLRSTLEALYIEQSLRQAELSRSAARHDEYVAAAGLLAAMGLMQAQVLAPGVDVYDPAHAFRAVRDDGAVPWEGVPAALDGLNTPSLKRLAPPPTAPLPTQP
jgi:outer membrane protein